MVKPICLFWSEMLVFFARLRAVCPFFSMISHQHHKSLTEASWLKKKTWHAIRSLRLFRFKTHPNQTDQTSAVNPWGSPWFTHASSTVASVLSTFLYDVSLQVLTRIDHRDIQLFQQTWKVLGNGNGDDPFWGPMLGICSFGFLDNSNVNQSQTPCQWLRSTKSSTGIKQVNVNPS